MLEVYPVLSCDEYIIIEGSALLLWAMPFLGCNRATLGRKNRATGREWGRKPGEGEQGQWEEEMRLRKGAATRQARTRFWPRTDPTHHLATQGELQLIIKDFNIISIAGRKKYILLCCHDSSDENQIRTRQSHLPKGRNSQRGRAWEHL